MPLQKAEDPQQGHDHLLSLRKQGGAAAFSPELREASIRGQTSQVPSSSPPTSQMLPSKIKDGRYEIDKKLGAGCFGEVYLGREVATLKEVAVKVEDLKSRTQQLEQEANILILLQQPVAPQGFSECLHFGREGGYHCLVMGLLGKSLEDCVQDCKGTFSALSTSLVAEQLVCRLEYLHSKGIVHRDIKPENFMWGNGAKVHHLYMIDFGLSKRYYIQSHVLLRTKLALTGTARYASINAHKGTEQSRRDDLEAVGHMLLYFLRGVLPWSGLNARTKQEKYQKIHRKKEETDLNDLCSGFPDEFCVYLRYCRNLEFSQRPDYTMLRELFQTVRTRLGPAEDHQLQWLADQDIDTTSLEALEPWTPPRQPDDVELEAHRTPLRRAFFFLGGKVRATATRLRGVMARRVRRPSQGGT